jgi:hypothetical protein
MSTYYLRSAAKRKADQLEQSTSNQQSLPNEILHEIVDLLKGDNNTLAALVRVDRNMYDIVIPHLYDTVTITERNKVKIAYGHTLPFYMYKLEGELS